MSKMKKAVSLMLAILITVGILSACGGNSDSADNSVGTGGRDSAQSKAVSADGVTFPLEETVTFSIMTRAPSDTEQDFTKKKIIQRLQEATNIKIDWQVIPDEQFDEKYKLALSKSSMPDVITKMYIKPYDILGYANKGVLIALEDLIDQYMPNLTAILEKRPEVRNAITSTDGHIYTLPFIEETSTDKEAHNVVGAIPYINKSWLDQLGLAVPETTLELETALIAFQQNIRPEAGDVIPMSFRLNQVNQDPGINLGAFGCGDDMDHYMVTNDGEVYYTLVQPEVRKGLEWLNSLYSRGLIDPEVFSMDASTYSAKVSSGRVGLFYDWAIEMAADYQDEYVALPAVAGPDGTKNIPRQNYYTFDMGVTAITANCENPEIVAAALDLCFEPLTSIQICYGTYDDENYINTFERNDDGTLSFTEEGISDGIVRGNQNLGGIFAILAEYYGEYVDMLPGTQKRLDMIKENYTPYIDSDYYYPAAFMTQEEINQITQIETDLKPYAESVKAEIVKNGISDADWEAYLQKMDEMKLQKLMELKQKGFDEFWDKSR